MLLEVKVSRNGIDLAIKIPIRINSVMSMFVYTAMSVGNKCLLLSDSLGLHAHSPESSDR